ncbi:unnamed protein product, partial [Urochloa humidicola]
KLDDHPRCFSRSAPPALVLFSPCVEAYPPTVPALISPDSRSLSFSREILIFLSYPSPPRRPGSDPSMRPPPGVVRCPPHPPPSARFEGGGSWISPSLAYLLRRRRPPHPLSGPRRLDSRRRWRIFELCGGIRRDAKGSRGLRPSGGHHREAPRGRGPLPLRGRGRPPTPLRPHAASPGAAGSMV